MAAGGLLGFRCAWRAALLILSLSVPATRPYRWTCSLPSPRGPTVDCYDGKCNCTENIANCSNNHDGLLFVPSLPGGIQVLDLSRNNLKTIPDDFFVNVTNITSLRLCYTPLVHISNGAFFVLKRLETLVMMGNSNLTAAAMNPVFGGYTLNCISLQYDSLHFLPGNLYNTSRLGNLYLFHNKLRLLNMSRLESLSNLRQLDWSGNFLQDFVPAFHGNLEVLVLAYNLLTKFPGMCSADGSALLPRLTWLDLKKNQIYTIRSPLCLPELQHLRLSGNRITTIDSNMFDVTRFPSLIHLKLGRMCDQLVNIEKYAFNNSRLQSIAMKDNYIDFSAESIVHLDSFVGCSNLNKLHIGGNLLFDLTDARFHRLFGHLTGLQEISMNKSFLQTIPVKTFAKFPNLTNLHLRLNRLAELPDEVFASNPHLEMLSLNDNRITTITPTTFTEENRRHLRSLDLSGNPFVCDCDLRWFSRWLLRDSAIFHTADRPYVCSNNRSVKVVSFSMPDQPCMLTHEESQIIMATMSIVLLVAILLTCLFRLRWHIRLLLYEAFRGNEAARRRRLETGRFDYDVFVSFAEKDCQWVMDHLVPQLEGRLRLRLCVHPRDFIAGKNIVDNIADCVERSKKTLMVFSVDFVCSQWCQFELSYCLRHIIENEDDLVIVCLGDVASRNLTSTMMAVLKTTVYLQWLDGNADASASFWGRLKIALQEVTPRSNTDEVCLLV